MKFSKVRFRTFGHKTGEQLLIFGVLNLLFYNKKQMNFILLTFKTTH